MTTYSVDELDHQIIEALGADGRVSNRQIAAQFGVTEGTIRTRIKRLQAENLLQFTVVTSFAMAGSPNLVIMGIHADPVSVPRLARELSARPELGAVMVLLGRFNLLVSGLFTSVEEVDEFVRNRVRPLPGVRSVEVSYSIRSVKYDAKIARIVPPGSARR